MSGPGNGVTVPLPDPAAEIGRVVIGEIALSYRDRDGGGRHYLQRNHVEEYHSPLYPLLRQVLAPALCLDIGANYGYTGLMIQRAFPDSRLVLVEPIPWLEPYIRYNFASNSRPMPQIHSAICSSPTPAGRSRFGLRPTGTQDSRVIPQRGMEEIETSVVTLDQLTAGIGPDEGVYIKIDTQGWEARVFEGGQGFLGRHDRWFVKTEFAPQWLESQGTDPVNLLRWLLARFAVHESLGRVRWSCRRLDEAIGPPLRSEDAAAFVGYVRNLARDDKGWIDLYVLPPQTRRRYG